MYDNYHSNYIIYPILQEHKLIQYLKDHKLKNIMEEIIKIIKPLEDILIELTLEEKLIIRILFSTTITGHILEHTIKRIKTITQDYNNIIIQEDITYEETFNIIRGFN